MITFQPFEGDPLSDAKVSVTKVGAASVVRLSSPQILELQAKMLARHLGDLATRAGGRLVVELSGVAKFSCSWINELISLTSRCKSMKGCLVIAGMNDAALKMLHETKLDRRLNLARDEHDALEMVGSPAVSPWRLALARALSIPIARPGEDPDVARAA